jgi:glycosyltransferase involved in cell wall biosynthesis
MTNLLFCSIAFPPKSDPECLQTAKYFKYLQQDMELSIEVLTSKVPTLNMPEDKSLRTYIQKYEHKLELPVWENRYTNFLLRKLLPEGIDYPDSKFSFHWQWKKAAKRLKQRPDVIYSRSFPMSSAVMALRLQKHFQVPWIMHLSDPWADSPLHHYSKKQYAYHKAQERECLQAAHKVCLTSEQTIRFYSELYPEFQEKFLYFPNVYEQSACQHKPVDFRDKLRIVYTGGLAGDRSATYFLEALKRLIEKQPTVGKQIEVVFAGALDRKNQLIFAKNQLECVKHLGMLTYEQARELQQQAHILLNIDNPVQDARLAMFFPSKLLDYMTARRRIWVITTRGSASESVMKNLKGEVFSHDGTLEIQQKIAEALEAFQRQDHAYFESSSAPVEFEAQYNAQKLAQLLKLTAK